MTPIDDALAELLNVLQPYAEDADWTVAAGSLEWSCWETAVHIAHDLTAYAGQLAARPTEGYLPMDLTVPPGTPPREVLHVITAAAGLLGSALATAGPEVRAFHWGACDPSGFEAMGVAEALLHTYDITRGLKAEWLPPAGLSTLVMERLFPEFPVGTEEPARLLLWATGRAELPGREPRTEWVWAASREQFGE
ncbi:hypothetical protein ACFYVL_29195 [Streptomyces sp. NPDC004111]|uniref:hypothetical protein n=1 Tax=Streptomyces sp. NPDC004111 TaxID=3364690 RepID=UPI003682BFB9